MAKELAQFQNFAKLKDTKVAFNDITVIAGKPGTGKSYVMKFMYAIDEAIFLLNYDTTKLAKQLSIIKLYSSQQDHLNDLWSSDDLDENLDEALKLSKELKELKDKNNFLVDNKLSNNTALESFENKLDNLLNSIFASIEQISDFFEVMIENSLSIKYEKSLSISIDNKFKTLDLKEVIFVETPLILEFKKFMRREEGKTPYHIESLLNILDTDYAFTDKEQDKFIKDFTKKSKDIIKGDVESSGDSFVFNQEDGKNYDILNASSGTKSIGLLQYLVTNKALKKGSVLYWEEPEVHLHPEWQLRMVELFVELMSAGVKIVFSTHSPYMCDYLNAISQKQGFDDRVSFNLFEEKDGVVKNHILGDDNWNKIQAELLDPLEEIMWEYI